MLAPVWLDVDCAVDLNRSGFTAKGLPDEAKNGLFDPAAFSGSAADGAKTPI